jgi:hypothetical protein
MHSQDESLSKTEDNKMFHFWKQKGKEKAYLDEINVCL